jgi:hypothetical protein
MTLFLDVRLDASGGDLATTVAINQGASLANYLSISLSQLLSAIQGRNVLIATHGFNVDRADGIACLSNWEGLLDLPAPAAFVGLLWPGDSVWLHALAYPEEPRVADDAGQLIGPFLDANFGGAASISLASHSLGARVLLSTVSSMTRPIRRAIIMAGAVDDDCLTTEFQAAAAQIGEISALASQEDMVLAAAFPAGNFFGGILDAGHPWWNAALGREGPAAPWPGNFQAPFEIPDSWDFGHGDYLKVDPAPPITTPIAPPINVLPDDPEPQSYGWQEAWTAAFASTRFQ